MRLWSVILTLCLISAVRGDMDQEESGAESYTTEQFKENVNTSPHFVMFYAPWCGHCKRLAPTFDLLGKKFNEEGEQKEVTIAKVDCTVETALCSDQGVTGYPTLKFYKNAESDAEKYHGPRDEAALTTYIKKQLGQEADKEEEAAQGDENDPEATNGLYDLTEATFTQHVERGYHFVKFYAPWCGHCKRLAPTWEQLAKTFENDKEITVAKVDCTQHSNVCTQNGIRGYPTLILFKDGKDVEKYSGSREHDSLKDYLNKIRGKADPNTARTDEQVPEKEEEEGAPGMAVLSPDNFNEAVAGKKALIKFYAPWCGHCKRLAPTWDDLAKTYKDYSFVIGKVDCTVHRELCSKYDVKGYPTLLYFDNGEKVEKYSSGRELEYLKDYVNKKLAEGAPEEDTKQEEEKEAAPASTNVVVLTDDNFEQKVAEGNWFIKFYAPWCGHCKSLAPTWEKLADEFASGGNEVNIAKMDCTVEKVICKKHEIAGFPTLLFFKKGIEMAEHDGSRDLPALKEFAVDFMAADPEDDVPMDYQDAETTGDVVAEDTGDTKDKEEAEHIEL